MRLTENMIVARTKQSDLSAIKRINLWGCDLTDISIIRNMTNVEVLALSINNLSCLEPLESCLKLQMLYLRKNNISNFNELKYLQNLPALTELWLCENPCAIQAGPNYRACVLKMLPNLKNLDDEQVTAADIEAAKKLDWSKVDSKCFSVDLNFKAISPRRETEIIEKIESPKIENQKVEEKVVQTQAKIEPNQEIENISLMEPQIQEETTVLENLVDIKPSSSPVKPQLQEELETPRQLLPHSSTSNVKEPQIFHRTPSLNQIPQQSCIEQPIILNIQYPDQRTDNRNINNTMRLEQQGSVTSRSLFLPELQLESGFDNHSRSAREISSCNEFGFQLNFPLHAGFQTNRSTNTENLRFEAGSQSNRSNASTSTQWNSTQSNQNSRRNSNILSALLHLVRELDIDGLQVLEDSVRCRLNGQT